MARHTSSKGRRPQANKMARFESPDLSVFAQQVKVTRDCPSGLLGFSMHSVARQRADMEQSEVIECLTCDSFHVAEVLA